MVAEALLLQNRNEGILLHSNCRVPNGVEINGSISRICTGKSCRNHFKGVSRSLRTQFSASLPSPGADPSPVVILKEKPDRSSKKLKSNEEPQLASDSNHKSGSVALIGKPNVGKSTLMNRLIGQKLSIVTNKPQTTRHRILGICSSTEYQMIFYDTPGIMSKKRNKLEEIMMHNVNIAMLNADCVMVVVNAADDPIKVSEVLGLSSHKLLQSKPSLLVMNKRDMIKPGEIAKKMEWYQENGGVNDVLAVSAKFGHGIGEIKEWIVSKLPLRPALYPKEHISDQPDRFFAAEILREKIFLQYFKDIPYVSQVNAVKFVPRTAPAKDFIELEIIVEKELQKAIIIGKEGGALKALASAGRADIEELLGREVYLEIKVKVKEDWRADESLLKSYGYSSC